MSEATHTAEPWQWKTIGLHPRKAFIFDRETRFIAETDDADMNTRDANANARRIVACVNACRSITTAALEAGVVAEMLAALRGLVDHAMLDLIVPQREPTVRNALAAIAKIDAR